MIRAITLDDSPHVLHEQQRSPRVVWPRRIDLARMPATRFCSNEASSAARNGFHPQSSVSPRLDSSTSTRSSNHTIVSVPLCCARANPSPAALWRSIAFARATTFLMAVAMYSSSLLFSCSRAEISLDTCWIIGSSALLNARTNPR